MKPRSGFHALPDFLIIGAQKSATTSLLAYTGLHSGVRLGAKKTAHFFDLDFQRGVQWYARHFPFVGVLPALLPCFGVAHDRAWVTGESCPAYMFLPEVPGRVCSVLPGAKIIVILREPVDRLVSQYRHEQRKGRAPGSFAEFVAPSLTSDWPASGNIEYLRQQCAVPRGFYAAQLRHWLGYFPADRIHVIAFEELLAAPEDTLSGIFRFLGVTPEPIDTSTIHNRGAGNETVAVDAGLRAELEALYREQNAELPRLLGRTFPW